MTGPLAKEQFPALVANPGIVYLDSAATAQKPQRVVDAVTAQLSRPGGKPGPGDVPNATGFRHLGVSAGFRGLVTVGSFWLSA